MKTNTPVKAIIFDLGGVIARIDFHRPMLGIRCFTDREQPGEHTRKEMMKLIFAYEIGKIDSESFLRALQSLIRNENPLLPQDVPSLQTIKDIWNSMITELPVQNLELLTKIGRQYPIYLLSNTNELHIRYVETMQPDFRPVFSGLFRKMYCSHELGLHKPDPEIYRAVCRDMGFAPEDCLFIDDRPENIEGARQTGMQALLLTDFDLSRIFTEEGLLNPPYGESSETK